MKKLFILTLAFCMFFSINTYAKEDIQVVFEQPAVYSASSGDELAYSLVVKLPKDYKNIYKSFAVSLLMDSNLKISSKELVGANEVKNKVELKNTLIKKTAQNLVTFTVNDVNLIKESDIRINIKTKVIEDIKGEGALKNSFVLTSVDKNGKENSKQKDLTANTKAQEGVLEVDKVNSKSNAITGKTEKFAVVKVFLGKDELSKTIADVDGNFKVKIKEQSVGTELKVVSYFKKNEEDKEVKSSIVVTDAVDGYVPENIVDSTIKAPNKDSLIVLKDYIDWAKSLNTTNVNKEDYARLNAAIAIGEYVEVKSKLSQKDIDDAYEKIKTAMSYLRKPYMNGKSKDIFAPKSNMTRAEIAFVLSKLDLNKEPEGRFTSFKDVKADAWYADAVGYMQEKEIISGYKDNSFKPEAPLTRAEFAAVISKFAKLEISYTPTNYKDVNENNWARDYIDIVTSRGLMKGRAEGVFAPNDPITRAEVVTVLNKLLDRQPQVKFMEKYSKNPYKDLNKNFWAYYEILEATGN